MRFLEVPKDQEAARNHDAGYMMERLQLQYSGETWTRVKERTRYCKQPAHPETNVDHWEVLAKSDDGRVAIWLWDGPDTGVMRVIEEDEAKQMVRRRGFLSRMRYETKVLLAVMFLSGVNNSIQEYRFKERRRVMQQMFLPAPSSEPAISFATGTYYPISFSKPMDQGQFASPSPTHQSPWVTPIDAPGMNELPQLKLSPEELALLDATMSRLEERRKADEKNPAPQSGADRR